MSMFGKKVKLTSGQVGTVVDVDTASEIPYTIVVKDPESGTVVIEYADDSDLEEEDQGWNSQFEDSVKVLSADVEIGI